MLSHRSNSSKEDEGYQLKFDGVFQSQVAINSLIDGVGTHIRDQNIIKQIKPITTAKTIKLIGEANLMYYIKPDRKQDERYTKEEI